MDWYESSAGKQAVKPVQLYQGVIHTSGRVWRVSGREAA